MATVLQEIGRTVSEHVPRDWPNPESVSEVVRDARKAVAAARQATTDAAERLELAARRRPLAAVGVAAAAGFVVGGALAFALGWFAGRRIRT
jgi:ElaB/YqjD/DUF883 family membrane-anchored ribosome-binding protein